MDFLWFLHDLRSPALTAIFRVITFLGEETLPVLVLCALYWCVNKDLAYGLSISFFVSLLIVQGLKVAVRIDRPWLLDPAFMPVEAALETATGYSFPSGHTQTAASLFGYLGLASRKKGWIAASWALVLLVGLSRMYLGVHTPADVFAAMAISLVISLATLAYMRSGRSELILASVLGALSVVVLSYAITLHAQGTIETHYLADCCKAAGGCIGCAIGYVWAKRGIPFSTETPQPWQQFAKLFVGLVVLILLKDGLKLVFGSSLTLDAIRYALIAIWALALYPLLFSKLFRLSQA